MSISLYRVLLFNLLLVISLPGFACGTANNWMDTYQGLKSNNSWRDNMNQLETLVMLNSCGGLIRLNINQQKRLSTILTDAIRRSQKYAFQPSKNRDIRNEVKPYRGMAGYRGLLKSIYHRFHCLPDVENIKLSKRLGKC